MNSNSALIITGNKYPNGDPGAVRQHSMAKLFEGAGYKPFVIGYGESNGKKILSYDGIEYTSLRPSSENKAVRIISRLMFGSRVIGFIKKKLTAPKVIMVVDVLPEAFRKIERYAYSHNCILIHDSVEWYSPEELKNGEKNIEYRLKEYTNRKAIHSPWRVISISRYLDEYFKGQGLTSVRIPVVLDVEAVPYRTDVINEKTVFVYAGSPGLKDHIKEMLEGYSLIKKQLLEKSELHLIGIDRVGLKEQCGVLNECIEELGESLVLHGRLPREQTVERVRNADFTVLVRNSEQRYAKAGFPTKAVESLSCGTPIVCNLSSDLELYLKDKENSVLISDNSPIAIAQALSAAIQTDRTEREKMRKAARKTAEDYFDYRVYREVFGNIIGNN